MFNRSIFASCLLVGSVAAQIPGEIPLKNWPAPLYWQLSEAEAQAVGADLRAHTRTPTPHSTSPAGSLVFVAMTPCRVVDTRASSGFPSPFGAPSLSSGPARSFPMQSSTVCFIPSIAMAYSLNVTLVPPGPVGYLTIWPTGAVQPNAVTVDDITGDIRNNAAIVPAGSPSGSISAVVNATTDLVIDINGYYAPSTEITLSKGTAFAPSLSFSGDEETGIFSSGTGALNFASVGINALTVRPDLDLDLVGNIRQLGTLFLHTSNTSNLGVGLSALASSTTGTSNTGIGYLALYNHTTGLANTATGTNTLLANSSGTGNTSTGAAALQSNTTGNYNTATGFSALNINSFGSYNTAVGNDSLSNNTSGGNNTAIGGRALLNNKGGSNTALGYNAGISITTGSNNVDIVNTGASTDSGIIRVGTSPVHTAFFAAGIRGITTGNQDAMPVMIDSAGQLGTNSSSRRYKEDIHDMADASSGLQRLRPVTFRYRKPYADASKPLDYGLIAEEVAEIYPDLVVKGTDGQAETVQYQKLTPMLVNEVQKLQAQVAALRKALENLLPGSTVANR